jgi:hypothetical protein
MHDEGAFFGTTVEACGCAETVHLSSMYHADIPCGHRYVLGAAKPVISSEMTLLVHATTTEME